MLGDNFDYQYYVKSDRIALVESYIASAERDHFAAYLDLDVITDENTREAKVLEITAIEERIKRLEEILKDLKEGE